MVAIDRWRRLNALRRGGGGVEQFSGPEVADPGSEQGLEPSTALALDVALDALRVAHPDWFAVVIERYIVGRSQRETASQLGISPGEVRQGRRSGLAWMRQSMSRPGR